MRNAVRGFFMHARQFPIRGPPAFHVMLYVARGFFMHARHLPMRGTPVFLSMSTAIRVFFFFAGSFHADDPRFFSLWVIVGAFSFPLTLPTPYVVCPYVVYLVGGV